MTPIELWNLANACSERSRRYYVGARDPDGVAHVHVIDADSLEATAGYVIRRLPDRGHAIRHEWTERDGNPALATAIALDAVETAVSPGASVELLGGGAELLNLNVLIWLAAPAWVLTREQVLRACLGKLGELLARRPLRGGLEPRAADSRWLLDQARPTAEQLAAAGLIRITDNAARLLRAIAERGDEGVALRADLALLSEPLSVGLIRVGRLGGLPGTPTADRVAYITAAGRAWLLANPETKE